MGVDTRIIKIGYTRPEKLLKWNLLSHPLIGKFKDYISQSSVLTIMHYFAFYQILMILLLSFYVYRGCVGESSIADNITTVGFCIRFQ